MGQDLDLRKGGAQRGPPSLKPLLCPPGQLGASCPFLLPRDPLRQPRPLDPPWEGPASKPNQPPESLLRPRGEAALLSRTQQNLLSGKFQRLVRSGPVKGPGPSCTVSRPQAPAVPTRRFRLCSTSSLFLVTALHFSFLFLSYFFIFQ